MNEVINLNKPQLDPSLLSEYKFRMNSAKDEKAASIFPHIVFVENNHRILSIGAGGGGLEFDIIKHFDRPQIIALDYSLPMIEDLNDNQNLKPINQSKIKCLAANADSIPLASESVSTIVASSVVHEISTFGDSYQLGSSTNQFVLESGRILHPKGHLIIRDFMQPENPNKLIDLIIGTANESDPMDPSLFISKFINDFHGSDLNYIKQQLPQIIVPGTHLRITQADALEIAGHYSWSRRYPDEIKERYAYLPIKSYVNHIIDLSNHHQINFEIEHSETFINRGYVDHINGRLDFYPSGLDQPPYPPIFTGIMVFKKLIPLEIKLRFQKNTPRN